PSCGIGPPEPRPVRSPGDRPGPPTASAALASSRGSCLQLARAKPLFLRLGFELEPQVVLEALRIEPSLPERRAHRAAGLHTVGAVREAAVRSEFRDVREGLLQSGRRLPELQRAHSGRIEEERAAWQGDDLAVPRGMATSAIRGAYLLDP